jgi:hypothetical protein
VRRSGEDSRSVIGGPSGWVVLVRRWRERGGRRSSVFFFFFFFFVFCYNFVFIFLMSWSRK